MKAQPRKAVERLSPNQCCHLSPTGRRCRAARSSPTSCLCPRHRNMEQSARSADLSPDLAARLTDIRESLQSVEGVRDSLAELYVLLAQNRVSPRRAAVLAHISNLLLGLIPDDEADAEPEKPTVQFIFGRAPKPGVAAAAITDESQLTEDCPGAFYTLRRDTNSKKGALSSEEQAIANFKAIST
jgi:hypothetical protein